MAANRPGTRTTTWGLSGDSRGNANQSLSLNLQEKGLGLPRPSQPFSTTVIYPPGGVGVKLD